MLVRLEAKFKPDLDVHGGKVIGLSEIQRSGFQIPLTLVVPKNYEPTREELEKHHEYLSNCDKVIVRSSSSHEDVEGSSMAGVFDSEIVEYDNLIPAIKDLRLKAIESSERFNLEKSQIALLIQPIISDFAGGVYLSDHLGNDKLVISTMGVSAVTSGVNTPLDTLDATDPLYQKTLELMRMASAKLGGQVDIEFAVKEEGKLVFLQKRMSSGTLAKKSTISDFEQSNHFPNSLTSLEGTIWHDLFETVFPGRTLFTDQQLFERTSAKTEESSSSPLIDKGTLTDANEYYHEVLFPKWEGNFLTLERFIKECSDDFLVWKTVHFEWKMFYVEYFTNPYHHIVGSSKGLVTDGVSLAPNIVTWLGDLFALKERSEQDDFQRHFDGFVAKYYYYFFNNNSFSEPPLGESPSILKSILQNLPKKPVAIEKIANPPIELSVAWICEEDNRYKYMYNYLLRKAIRRLSNALSKQTLIPNIWNLRLSQISNIKDGINVEQLGLTQDAPLSHQKDEKPLELDFFPADVLSEGNATAEVCNNLDSFVKGQILVKPSIEMWDYPLLLNSSGAITSLGSQNYHSAVFARDINKPLFKSSAAVANLKQGQMVELDSEKRCVRILKKGF